MAEGETPRGRGLLASPTVQLLILFVLSFAIGRLGLRFLALSLPLEVRPWTVVTSVYTHASLGHLVANAVALAVVGFALERASTPLRFHGFVLATGALSGLAEVVVAAALGRATAVLGASGAVLALYGYVLAGNPLTAGVLARIDPGRRGKAALLVGIVAAVVLLTGGPNVALAAHATGFLLGTAAGRLRLLRAG